MGVFKNIAKWVLIGGGSVLSLIPGVGPLVGGGLIAAGAAIKNDSTTSSDPVSNATTILAQALTSASTVSAASQGAVINQFNLMEWIAKNWLIIAGVLGAIFLLPKLLNRRR